MNSRRYRALRFENRFCIALTILLTCVLPTTRTRADFTNLVLIVLDAARADHCSAYGYPLPTTPELDALSANGILFEQHFANATYTVPSLACMISSRYFSLPLFINRHGPHRAPFQVPVSVQKRFDDRQVFLPKLFRNAGYDTAFFHDHAGIRDDSRLARLFDETHYIAGTRGIPHDDVLFPAAIAWLAQPRSKPFFLNIHVMSPHSPYPVKADDRIFLGAGSLRKADVFRQQAVPMRVEDQPDIWDGERIRLLTGLYNANLHHTDAWLGRFRQFLETSGLSDGTIIIVTADHGEALGDGGFLTHAGPPRDSVLHIPLVLCGPGIPVGRRVSGLSESIDMVPTLLDLSGLTIPRQALMDGSSLVPAMLRGQTEKNHVFTDCSIRNERYRLVLPQRELFDCHANSNIPTDGSTHSTTIANALHSVFQSSMEPRRQRYAGSIRRTPPPIPFSLTIELFDLTPDQHLGFIFDHRRDPEEWPQHKKPWSFNRHWSAAGLVPRVDNPPPVKLSLELPDGVYGVSAAFEIPDGSQPLNLQYRWKSSDHFRLALSENIPAESERNPILYFNLENVNIEQRSFSLEICFSRSGTEAPVLRFIEFYPSGCRRESEQLDPERRQRLKSLGYL